MTNGHKLRTALAGQQAVIAPGVYDALTALLAQQAGFGCAYLSGASVSFTRIGRPDIGLTTLTEVADTVSCIRDRVELPLIVDADTGFGNALNVIRTVRVLERAGATAIQLEDQTSPKRCGHLAGKSMISTAEMVGKLQAALDTRTSSDTLIVARTDAVAIDGIDAALERAHAYVDAGADVLFVEALRDEAQMQRVAAEFASRLPLLINMVEGGKTPLRPAAELARLGFRLVIYPGAMVRVISFAAQAYLRELRASGTTANMLDRMNNFEQIMALVGLEDSVAEGQRYAPDIQSACD